MLSLHAAWILTPFILNTKVESATDNKTSRGSQSSSGFVLNTRDYEPTVIATAYGDTLTFILDTRSSSNPDEDSDKDGIPVVGRLSMDDKDVANTYLDPDGDGLNNLQEYLLGSDPNDGNSANADRDRLETSLLLGKVALAEVTQYRCPMILTWLTSLDPILLVVLSHLQFLKWIQM